MITAICAAAVLTGAVSVTAGAASIDDEALTAAPFAAEPTGENNLPAAYSSLEHGYVTGAKTQTGNDCWVYATLGTLESKLLQLGYSNIDMSDTHLNLWATTRDNGKGWIRNTSGAAYCSTGAGYLASWQGGVLAADATDLIASQIPTGDKVPTDRARWGVTSIRYLNGESRDVIKRAIMENGGIAAGYSHNSSYLKNNVAYFLPPSYNGVNNGHLVEIVGWNDNYSKTNFRDTPQNDGAWLMKSSWGTGNPLNGFYWISYEDKWLFGSKYKPAMAIETLEEITDDKKMVQNEIYGATYEFDYLDQNEITFVNRLHFDEEYALLDKVIFETRCSGASYSLYYVPDENGAPVSNQSAWIPLGSGVTDYAGYICADIDDIELPDAVGSIAVTLHSNNSAATIGVDEWLTASGDYVFLNESEYGMSYLYQNGKMTDLMQWYKDENDDDIGGTFVIKALTRQPETGDVNLDGMVNIDDATLVQRYLVELATLSDRQLALSDVNHDGIIDISDVTTIQMIIAGYFE